MDGVVITGIGLVSCLGHRLDEVTEALRAARSGIVVDPERVERGFRSPLTGRIPPFDPRELLTRKERRSMGEPALYAAVAALRAIEDAGLDRGRLARPDVGVILGNDSTCDDSRLVADRVREDGGTAHLGSAAIVRCMNSTATMNLSVLLGTRGACWTVSSACASGANALGQAATLVATGQQDVVLCGGTQEVNWAGMAAFDALGTFSSRVDDPAGASRPFSADRDGLVPGGGAAVLVVESLAHARARGARIRASILGYAFTSDGIHVTSPDGRGAVRCMRRCLEQARVLPEEVEYVNAHAASTPVGDRVEARAILDVFGGRSPPVSSTKSLTGHECWMAGASEVAYSLLAAEAGFLPPNRNFTAPDEGCEALRVVTRAEPARPRLVLSNSFGFGGTNASLLLQVGEPA